jgi:hypothetical protein
MSTLIQSDEVDARLSDPNNLLNKLREEFAPDHKDDTYVETVEPGAENVDYVEVNELKIHNGGRTEGAGDIDPKIQAVIGVAARLDTAKNVAAAFGVSRQQVHNLKHGRTTDKHGVNPRLANDMQLKRETVADMSLVKLIEAVQSFDLNNVKDESKKIDAASKLAGIVEKMVPYEKNDGKGQGNKLVVNVYRPRTKDLDEYQILEVQAEVLD